MVKGAYVTDESLTLNSLNALITDNIWIMKALAMNFKAEEKNKYIYINIYIFILNTVYIYQGTKLIKKSTGQVGW